MKLNSFQIGVCTYWVDQNHAFVLEAQELGQEAKVALELIKQALHFGILDLDHERLWTVDSLGGDYQVTMRAKYTLVRRQL